MHFWAMAGIPLIVTIVAFVIGGMASDQKGDRK